MHIKYISPSGWDMADRNTRTIKMSSRGLIGNDRSDFLKTASHEFLPLLDSIKFAKDETPVHVLAMGATEFYDANRNGDGFKSATLRDYMSTFEKFAYWYRDHKNKDPKKSYGLVKKALFNAQMHRGELICLLNNTKEAAARNGGLVATRELEKLANGEDIPVSMACKIAFDVCSGCGNEAKTRRDYCTEDTCSYGGCRDNLCKVAEDGHRLHVDNPRPSFFDISDVYKGADRTASATTADYLMKSASDVLYLPSKVAAELYGEYCPVPDVVDRVSAMPQYMNRARMVVAMSQLEKAAIDRDVMAGVPAREWHPDIFRYLGRPGTKEASASLGFLADRLLFMNIRDFATWTKSSADVDEASSLLPSIYTYAEKHSNYFDGMLTSDFDCVDVEATTSLNFRKEAENLTLTHSFSRSETLQRAVTNSLANRTGQTKVAADMRSVGAEEAQLAIRYGAYKLAALERSDKATGDFFRLAALVHAQNCVD